LWGGIDDRQVGEHPDIVSGWPVAGHGMLARRLFQWPDRPIITAESRQFTTDFPMSIVAEPENPAGETRLTLADLADRFGPLPPERIRMNPPPGIATEEDAIRINERKEGLCELIDGILLEKTMGWYESFLGVCNTRKEMEDKLIDYFQSGVLEVWYIYPTRREVHQFVSLDEVAVIKPGAMVQSDRVLPGFALDTAKLFKDPRP
jgi:hypothetical protein